MKNTISLLLILVFAGWHFNASAQKIQYTVEEVEAIHDSIQQSRWDIGGRISQYSFRYMSEFFPVGIINKPSVAYPFISTPQKAFDNLIIKSKTDSLLFEDYLKKLHVASFIVIHKGNIVYEKYFSMLPEDQHTLQSVTKVITSTLITHLVNDKKIDISQPIERYIPELAGSDWQGTSVKDILHMRSGMEGSEMDYENGPFTNPKHPHYQFEAALDILPKTDETPSSVFQYFTTLKRVAAPGLTAEYNSGNTFVLGWLAEKVTGKKYADLVTDLLWKPMGASSNAYICLSDKGVPWTHGGMSSTLRDLARFGMLFTKSEMIAQKERIISFAQLQDIFDTPAIENSFAPFKWGYQWDFASDGTIMKGGFGGQALYVDSEREMVIAYFNYVDKGWENMNMISETAFNAIVKVIDGQR